MATLHSISISNFRGIKKFEQEFKNGMICIIGRGDSGKTTILDAISIVLSSSYNINFYDSDFHNCDTTSPIIIEATLTNIPEKLLLKYGDFVRGISKGVIIDDLESDEARDAIPALTIQLSVSSELEPSWNVICSRELEPKNISSYDRTSLNASHISDFADRHFSLNKGNPLYSLYKQLNPDEDDHDNVILDILRGAKKDIDEGVSEKFSSVIQKVLTLTKLLGLDDLELTASLDQRDFSFKDNKFTLHENDIPVRLKGRGTKRLISIAIQLSIADPNGIILIDEIELGLEPDRVQHLVRVLKEFTNFQILFTTHSNNVIVELPCLDLFILRKNEIELKSIPTELQGCVRSNPEAFFSKRIIVCEGATEVGICRAFNNYRETKTLKSLTSLGICYVDGNGARMAQCVRNFKFLGFDCCLICDSDVDIFNKGKEALIGIGIKVIDCETGYSIEQQLFKDLKLSSIIGMIEYLISFDNFNDRSIFQSVYSKTDPMPDYNDNWYKVENAEIRVLLGNSAKEKGWYKRIDHGMVIGELVFKSINELDETNKVRLMFNDLSSWVDK